MIISSPTLLFVVLQPDGVVKAALLIGSNELLPVSTCAAASAEGQAVKTAESHAWAVAGCCTVATSSISIKASRAVLAATA